MYEEFTNLFGDLNKRIEDGNIIVEGDININIIESFEKESSKKGKGKKAIKTLRNTSAVKKWRNTVKKRDKCCQCCGKNVGNKNLQAHHIAPIAKYPDLAADEDNGIALCEKCHSKYHQIYAGSEGPLTFAQFIKNFNSGGY